MTLQSGTPMERATEPDEMIADRRPMDIVRLAAGLVSAAIILAGLYYGQDILVPLAVAFLIGFALNPAVTWLTRRGIPRVIATSIAMTSVLIVIAAFGMLLATQIRSLAADFPTYQSTIQTKLNDLRDSMNAPGVFGRALKTLEGLEKQVAGVASGPAAGPPPQKVEVVGDGPTPLEYAATWLARAGSPLATTGIIFLFAFLILLDRRDLRDRFLQLVGSDVHRSTDSMIEAGSRVSRYLLMQLAVNASYGVPMGLGLWLIGVPGALLWGTFAAIMRFVPYVGPLISAVFPLLLAFAVDSGWTMVLWTVALIVTLELISNNIVEPLLYGSSTGLSAISLIASAMFWTTIWGPMGLVLSTPLTVCLLVLGRNVPQLQFLDTLLGSTQVLDLPSRLYQRLIAHDVDEAIDIADEAIEHSSPQRFYNDHGIQLLQVASQDYRRNATAEHRLRFATGMDRLIDALHADYPVAPVTAEAPPRILCIGGKWDIDTFAAEMLAHALALEGTPARALPAATVTASYVANLDLTGIDVVCISYFSRDPAMNARHMIKRLGMRRADLAIVIAAWNAPDDLLADDARDRLGATAIVTSVDEAVARIHLLLSPERAGLDPAAAEALRDDQRIAALNAAGLLDPARQHDFNAICKRAADIFNIPIALVSVFDTRQERFVGQSGTLPKAILDDDGTIKPVANAFALNALVLTGDGSILVPDVSRNPNLAENPLLRELNARFYAAAPLRTTDGTVLGALAIIDDEPRDLAAEEQALLETMANDALAMVSDDVCSDESGDGTNGETSSATIGQRLPE